MRYSLIAAMAVVLVLASTSIRAADTAAATASFAGEPATLNHAVALWDKENNRVSIGFFATAPGAAFLTEARKSGLCCANWEGAFAVLDFEFEKGTTTASADKFKWCHIGFYGFKKSPFDHNGDAPYCGLAEIAGSPKPGGAVRGKLAGKGETFAFSDRPAMPYVWDLSFDLTIQ